MSLHLTYKNTVDEELGRRIASDADSLVDDTLRSTSLSAHANLEPPLRFVDSIFIANYRDEAKAGTHAESHLVYVLASPNVDGRKANRFEVEVWFGEVHGAQGKIAAFFSGEPDGSLPAALTRGKVRFDWSPLDALVEIIFAVPYRETAGSFESSCRSIDAILASAWEKASRLSAGVESETGKHVPANKVFLCHSSKDNEFVRRLANALTSAGVPVWFDEDEILVGHDFVERMTTGLENSQFVAVVLSPNFVSAGPWAREEFRSALTKQVNENRTLVLPVLSQHCEIPLLLRSKRYADFSKSFQYGLGELLRAIKGPRD